MGYYINDKSKQWYGATIPYVIDNEVTRPERVKNAIQHWNDVTVARFVERGNQDDYIQFVQTNENSSSSMVGKQGGKQEINLGVNFQERTVIHEIGHAIGLKHEHQRPDRDNFITVHRDRVIDGKWDNNFKKKITNTVKTYDNYDLTSRMHYSQYTFAKPEHRYDWYSGWSTVEFYKINGVTYLFLLKKSDGSVHVHRMNSNGTVGSRVDTRDWSSGWTTAQPFTVGSQQYLFLLKEGNGHVHIHKFNNNGKVGTELQRFDWSSGWSTVKFYEINGVTYLFLLKKSDGSVHVHRMNSNGTVGNRVDSRNWSSGWTTAQPFIVGSQQYLFLLKEGKGHVHIHYYLNDGTIGNELPGAPPIVPKPGNIINSSSHLTNGDIGAANTILRGNVHIHKMFLDGNVGVKIDARGWTKGWTTAQPFTVGSQQYLFLLKEGNGHVHIHKFNINGKVGAEVKQYDWSSGWSTVEFYEINGVTYLFLLKKSDGSVHVHRMNSNGTVGSRIDTKDWSSGWTTAQPFTVGSQQYLFLLKEGKGHVHIHKFNNNGKVGAEVKRYDWSSGWSAVEFYTLKKKLYLFILKKQKD